ncbi:MAG TPA: glycosyl transferase group 1 [Ignavibacteriales bacterium]|nr:glycosyl transferase group 1 [Ignavibacteriales bacterium]
MKVLTVCREISVNNKTHNFAFAEFIFEQNKSLAKLGVIFEYYLIKEGGYKSYIKQISNFRFFLKSNDYNFDIIHAHGGHIGFIANFQRKIPVVTTYHGSDINNRITRLFSVFALTFSKENIFVSSNLLKKVRKYAIGKVIPCGVDFDIFKPLNKIECRSKLRLDEKDKIVLFAGDTKKRVKNFELAQSALELFDQKSKIIELKNFKRQEVNLLLNAADVLLLTSLTEGSPQVIKEAMACNCPIVATDVGDIREIISDTEGCYIASFNPVDVAEKIQLALLFGRRTDGNNRIGDLNNDVIAKKIFEVYNKAIL